MAENCGITEGLGCPTCEEIKSAAGIAKNLYAINRDDLNEVTPWNESANGTITGFNFNTYGYAYKFCSKNKSGSTNQELVVGDGQPVYTQTISGKFQHQLQDAKNILNDLVNNPDTIWVVEKNNAQFEVFGLRQGMTMSALTKGSGILIGEDNSIVFTLTGTEAELAPDFLNVSYANTKSILESYTP